MTCEDWLESTGLSFVQAQDRAREDLFWLITEVLCYDRYYKPLHDPLCREYRNASSVNVFLLPRDHLKSTTLTISGSVQELLRDPDTRILVSTQTLRTTLTMVKSIKRHFQRTERLLYLFPEYTIPEDGKGKGRIDEFSVPCRKNWARKEPSVCAASVDVSQVSRHFDVMYLDDLQTDRNSKTDDALQAIHDHWNSLWPMLDPDGRMFIIGTRWDQGDMYSMVLEKAKALGAKVSIRSALERCKTTGKVIPIYPKTDAGKKVFSRDVLAHRRRAMGDYQFGCQFMNRAVPDKHVRILHPRQVIYRAAPPDKVNYFTVIDPAVSLKKEADRTAIVTVGMDWMRNLSVVDVVCGNMRPAESAAELYRVVNQWKPSGVFCEANAWQTLYVEYLERLMHDHGYRVPIHEVPRKSTDTTIGRIMGLQPLFEQGIIDFLKGGRGVDEAIKEALGWSKARSKKGRDDICSALSDVPKLGWPPARPRSDQTAMIERHWLNRAESKYRSTGIGGHVRPKVGIA